MKTKFIAIAITLIGFYSTHASATPFAQCAATPAVDFPGTIVDAALATEDLSTLVTAVTAADLGDLLATAENITVYAPTNAAFANIPGPILTDLLADVEALTSVLAYHVSPGMQDPRKYIQPIKKPTLAMQAVFFSRGLGEPRVNNAAVSCTPVRASNGMVYIIDSVMIPNM
jgi:uncharacterized surface protein with fasciclin (FAS1) repeats